MKCPLFMAGIATHQKLYGKVEGDCLHQECAWWFPPTMRCSMLELAIHIREGDARLGQIISKMPYKKEI